MQSRVLRSMRFTLRLAMLGLVALAALTILALDAQATHLRGGSLGWKLSCVPDQVTDNAASTAASLSGIATMATTGQCSPGSVEFRGTIAVSLNGIFSLPAGATPCVPAPTALTCPSPGNPCPAASLMNPLVGTLNFGDSSFSGAIMMCLTRIDTAHCMAEGTMVDSTGNRITHLYLPLGSYTASFTGSARIVSGFCTTVTPPIDVTHVNNPGDTLHMETTVEFGPPIGTAWYPNYHNIAFCPSPPPTGSLPCNFNLNPHGPVDLPGGLEAKLYPRTFRLSTSAESDTTATGWCQLGMPCSTSPTTPWFAPPTSDLLHWNVDAGITYTPSAFCAACTPPATVNGDTLYSIQTMTETGTLANPPSDTKAPIDFFIALGCAGIVPYAPEDLTATDTSATTIRLDWKAPSFWGCPLHHYNVYRSANAAMTGKVLACSVLAPTTTCIDTVPPCSTFYYQVTAVTPAPFLESPPSNTASAHPSSLSAVVTGLPTGVCVACPPGTTGTWMPNCVIPCPAPVASGSLPSCTFNPVGVGPIPPPWGCAGPESTYATMYTGPTPLKPKYAPCGGKTPDADNTTMGVGQKIPPAAGQPRREVYGESGQNPNGTPWFCEGYKQYGTAASGTYHEVCENKGACLVGQEDGTFQEHDDQPQDGTTVTGDHYVEPKTTYDGSFTCQVPSPS